LAGPETRSERKGETFCPCLKYKQTKDQKRKCNCILLLSRYWLDHRPDRKEKDELSALV
jgi:ferredoxin-thioredoxin reductase catalytic subunit